MNGLRMNTSESYVVDLKEVEFFRLSEEVIDADVAILAERIAAANTWIAPITVERTTGIIMDGNHRWHAAVMLGLTHLPCILLDYADARVKVYEWEADIPFVIDDIFRHVMSRKVFPYKTTRHIFSPALPRTDIALSELTFPVKKFA
jgi:hypothetical protein